MMASAWGLVVASGKPEEFGAGVDPSFLALGSKPVLMHALAAFEKCPDIEGLVVLAPKDRVESVRAMIQMFGCAKVKRIMPMGPQRLGSILGVLKELQSEKVSVLTLHEGTRPMVSAEEISETIKVAKKHGAAALCEKILDPVRLTEKGTKVTDSPREGVAWSCRYPQSFTVDLLTKALEAAQKKKKVLRDEADALELVKGELHVVPATRPVIRISGPRDLVLADYLLRH
jgi:2-C-methyl-D-erythritol 4-phosphate cytidylyltransferase